MYISNGAKFMQQTCFLLICSLNESVAELHKCVGILNEVRKDVAR